MFPLISLVGRQIGPFISTRFARRDAEQRSEHPQDQGERQGECRVDLVRGRKQEPAPRIERGGAGYPCHEARSEENLEQEQKGGQQKEKTSPCGWSVPVQLVSTPQEERDSDAAGDHATWP